MSNPFVPLVRLSEHFKSVAPLHQATLFPYTNSLRRPSFTKATVAFSFRSIDFQKKRALPFFIAIELLTQQKCVASLARRNVLAWKVRKGRLVGCRVTLRRGSLFAFLDTLQLALPRREKLAPPSWISWRERILRSAVERRSHERQRIFENRPWALNALRAQLKNFQSPTSVTFSLGELVLLYPIERGLGLHPDVRRRRLTVSLSSRPREERYFLFRSAKLPVV